MGSSNRNAIRLVLRFDGYYEPRSLEMWERVKNVGRRTGMGIPPAGGIWKGQLAEWKMAAKSLGYKIVATGGQS